MGGGERVLICVALFQSFFGRYYFVILGGRDRRRETRLLELKRNQYGNITLGSMFSFVIIILIITIFWISIFLVLYILKRELGIDFFPDMHMIEFFNFFIGGLN